VGLLPVVPPVLKKWAQEKEKIELVEIRNKSQHPTQLATLPCSVKFYVAVCCSVLQCVTVCSSVLQGVAGCCRVLQGVAVCCSVLQCVAVCCSVQFYVAVCRQLVSSCSARYVYSASYFCRIPYQPTRYFAVCTAAHANFPYALTPYIRLFRIIWRDFRHFAL